MTRQPREGEVPISFGKLEQPAETRNEDINVRLVAVLKRHAHNKMMSFRVVAVLTRHAHSKQAQQEEMEKPTASPNEAAGKEDFKEHLLKAQAEEVQNMTKKSQRRKK
jgi:hypothetical protein